MGCVESPQVSDRQYAAVTCADFASISDATLSTMSLTHNSGSKKTLEVGTQHESLVRFGLDQIPPSAIVQHATLGLYLSHAHGTGAVNLHRVTADWSEANVTFESLAQQFDQALAGSIAVNSANVEKSVDLTAQTRRWVSGTDPNYGLLLESSQKKVTFVSREGGTPSQSPALRVCYAIAVDHCASAPCENGATCTNTETGYSCECPPGFTGANCELEIDSCAAEPCVNGFCTDEVDGYACACAAGFTGDNCEVEIDECAAAPCVNGGICVDALAGYECHCLVGYTGPRCETVIDNCASQPCVNGGACTNEVADYTCSCPPGYDGRNCEFDVDDCAGSPCLNGGTCIDGANSFICACPPDWGGAHCDVNLNSCAQQPCLNGGTCANVPGTYQCTCAPGYAGTNCEIDIDDCSPNPCEHQGVCVDGVLGYTCECSGDYSGRNCETPTDPCVESECQNGSTCLALTGEYAGNYMCSCPLDGIAPSVCDFPPGSGYSGRLCEAGPLAPVVPEVLFRAETKPDGTIALLTRQTNNDVSAAWTYVPGGTFRTDFELAFGPSLQDNGHQGFALVFAPGPGLGDPGPRLGYDGMGPSIAIEFDMHADDVVADPGSPHISIHTRGPTTPNSAVEVFSIARLDLPDSYLHGCGGSRLTHFWVQFEPARPWEEWGWIRVFGDCRLSSGCEDFRGLFPFSPLLEVQVADLGAPGYLGFTASTGPDDTGEIDIVNWLVAKTAP